MDKADLEDRVKMLEQQIDAQNHTANILNQRNSERIRELKTACLDAVECNFLARKYIIEHTEHSNSREFIAAEISIMSNRLRQVVKGKF